MSLEEIIKSLEMVESVTPDYSLGREKGYTDSEVEELTNTALSKALIVLDVLSEFLPRLDPKSK